MFVGDEILVDLGFPAARAGLARLARAGLLAAARDAHGQVSGVAADGLAAGPQPSAVHARGLASSAGRAGLAIRWEMSRPDGSLFPALDADLVAEPADGGTLLTLAGSYRTTAGPAGPEPDQAVRACVAAVIRRFLGLVAADIAGHAGPLRPAVPYAPDPP
jgi:hypothetical protein